MREISLSDGSGKLRPTAMAEIEIFMTYPNEDDSRPQALSLTYQEWERWKSLDPQGFKFSDFAWQFIKKSQQRLSWRTTCGLVALYMCMMDQRSVQPSLERAANCVSKLAAESPKLPFFLFQQQGALVDEKPILCDVPKIKSHFRAYRSVAHFCGTMVASAEHCEVLHPFDDAPLVNLTKFSTALDIQSSLSSVQSFDGWNFWHLIDDIHRPPGLFQSIALSEENLAWLEPYYQM